MMLVVILSNMLTASRTKSLSDWNGVVYYHERVGMKLGCEKG